MVKSVINYFRFFYTLMNKCNLVLKKNTFQICVRLMCILKRRICDIEYYRHTVNILVRERDVIYCRITGSELTRVGNLKKSRYKTNCDSEPVILHYIARVGRKYISHIGCATPPI